MKLHLDFETRSPLELDVVGAWAYASHPSTDVMCMGYATKEFNRNKPPTVLTSLAVRRPIHGIVGDHTIISAHNAAFEYAVYNLILHRRYGWPPRWDPKLWTCTMARAAACGLPLGLDPLSRVLGCKTPKDLEGRKIMRQLCKPLHIDALGDPIYDETPAKYERLYLYNANDVKTEMEVDPLLPELPPSERAVWELDLVMNRRGVRIDQEFARRAAGISASLVADLNGQLRTLTSGAIDKATQVAAIKNYLDVTYGVRVSSLDKVGVTDLLADPDVPAGAKRVIEVRKQVGKSTSTAKYSKALEMICRDGRVRGALQYHGAHTGRWAGRLLQLHNMPKGFKEKDQARAVEAIMADGGAELVSLLYGDRGMDALSDALRGLIIASEGKTLLCADYNAIELCVEMWLAGDEATCALLRRGEKPYVEMAKYIYRRDDITKEGSPKEYAVGKMAILGMGYGMGADKFVDQCGLAGIPLTKEDGENAVRGYRERYSGVVRMWYATEAAAINAVKNPGRAFPCMGGRVTWRMSADRRFLECVLPSGRLLRYWKPEIRPVKTPWGEVKDALCYWSEHPKTHQWTLLVTYGGALVENIVQATARDLMAHGMLACEAAGYEMLLTVHDELLAEAVRAALDHFIKTMCTLPTWAQGCPVAAEGWTGRRYHK